MWLIGIVLLSFFAIAEEIEMVEEEVVYHNIRDSGQYAEISPERRQWFKELRNPNLQKNHGWTSCCDDADVYDTQFRVNKTTGGDEWFYLYEGAWKRVPPSAILWDKQAPDNRAYLFLWSYDRKTVLCFIPPTGGI